MQLLLQQRRKLDPSGRRHHMVRPLGQFVSGLFRTKRNFHPWRPSLATSPPSTDGLKNDGTIPRAAQTRWHRPPALGSEPENRVPGVPSAKTWLSSLAAVRGNVGE